MDRMDLPADAGKTVDAPAPVVDAAVPDGNTGADTTLPERLELGAVSCGTKATMSFELPNRGSEPEVLVHRSGSERQHPA